ncbi:DUF6573 family protein [Shigella flexneri]|uniref:DUF6573 family protein n=1 Tax=Shigella flexneri TaxID=623 RepID=UPI003CF0D2CD|nr:hypothetical protein [Escherichia coli]
MTRNNRKPLSEIHRDNHRGSLELARRIAGHDHHGAKTMSQTTAAPLFTADDLIHSYSRAQAIEDGVLIDVSETAREAGFTVPVAITRAAWADCVEWTAETDKRKATCQDEAGRLWDVVYMARLAARVRGYEPRRLFELYRVPVEGRGIRPRRATLAMHIGPGDAGEPVITITLPNED